MSDKRMTIDEAIDVFRNPTQHWTCERNEADRIALECMERCKRIDDAEMVKIEDDVKFVSRWQTIESDEDVYKIFEEHSRYCQEQKCSDCKYNNIKHACIIKYLQEKVPKEDK